MTRPRLLQWLCGTILAAFILWSLWDAFAPDPCRYVDGRWNRSGCVEAPLSHGGIP